MKNIEILINSSDSQVTIQSRLVGVNMENLQGNIVFTFEDRFVDGIAWLEYDNGHTKDYIHLEKVEESYVLPIKSELLQKSGRINMQLRITEDERFDGIPVFKSSIFYLFIEDSINSIGDAPDEYAEWIDIANAKLLKFDTAITEVENLDVTLVEHETYATLTITDKQGNTTSVDIPISQMDKVNYEENVYNKPKINGVEVSGEKTLDDYGIQEKGDYAKRDELPKNTSQLVNDSGFIDKSVSNLDNYYDKTSMNTSLSGKANNSDIPVNISELYNDRGFITDDDLPTNVSELNNDSGFITNNVNNLVNYYDKTYVDNLIGDIDYVLSTLTTVSEVIE